MCVLLSSKYHFLIHSPHNSMKVSTFPVFPYNIWFFPCLVLSNSYNTKKFNVFLLALAAGYYTKALSRKKSRGEHVLCQRGTIFPLLSSDCYFFSRVLLTAVQSSFVLAIIRVPPKLFIIITEC